MKRRISLLILALALFLSGIPVQAAGRNSTKTVDKYISFFLDEIKGTKSEESIASLKTSLDELVKNIKPEDAKKIIEFVKEKIKEGKWETEAGIKEVIVEGEKKFDVTLTKEQKEMILSVVSKIKKLGIKPEYLVEQIEKVYEKYGDELEEGIEKEKDKIIEETQNKIKEEISKSVSNYFTDMVSSVKSFFKGILKR